MNSRNSLVPPRWMPYSESQRGNAPRGWAHGDVGRYALYGLTPDETAHIDGALANTRRAGGHDDDEEFKLS